MHLSEDISSQIFYKKPCTFNKNTSKEILAHALGATLYMPSSKNIANKIIEGKYIGLTSFVMCFEDAIRPEDVTEAESNVLNILKTFKESIKSGEITHDDIPLFFIRVRNVTQFKEFTKKLKKEDAKILTGFIFPKFGSENGAEYLNHLAYLNIYFDTILFGMPILESREIIYKETRMEELLSIKNLLTNYKELILNVRVGGTDFSSQFGLRRGIDYTIYDISVVSECLTDILNYFSRAEDGYVMSAPVWEYFSNQRMLKPEIRRTPFSLHNLLDKRKGFIDKAYDGLIREIILDKANGFTGKTIIHPSHIAIVNALQSVTREEYEDALMIIENQGGGVIKSSNGNKMNETNPHLNWAKKIIIKATIYGVVKENDKYVQLF